MGTRNKLEEGDKYFVEFVNYKTDSYLKKARQAYFEVEDNGLMSKWAQLYAKGMKAIASSIQEPGNSGSQKEAIFVANNLGKTSFLGSQSLTDPLATSSKDFIRSKSVSQFRTGEILSEYTTTLNEGVRNDGLVFATRTPMVYYKGDESIIPNDYQRTSWDYHREMRDRGYNIWQRSFYNPPFVSSVLNVIGDSSLKDSCRKQFLKTNRSYLRDQMMNDYVKSGGGLGLFNVSYDSIKKAIAHYSKPPVN
jgi:hypothetical protein